MKQKKEIPSTKSIPEKVEQNINAESQEISRELSAFNINSNIDDKISSIIIKRSENRVMDSPLKKGKSSIPSELWIG
jgi:hypothetical protein